MMGAQSSPNSEAQAADRAKASPASWIKWTRSRDGGALIVIRCPDVAWPALPQFQPTPSTYPALRTHIVGLSFFALSLLVYALTRFLAIDRFPIYFFVDEAILPVLASELIQHGLRDQHGTLLPLFFTNHDHIQPLIVVYAHAATVAIFGPSVVATRVTAAAITLLGAASVALILAAIFRVRFWWAGILFLGLMPAWFIHSRTAFELTSMVSFYGCFILCYLLYRYRTTLIAAFAAPLGGVVTEVGVTRVMAFLIPASVFMTLGLELLLRWVRGAVAQRIAFGAVFVVLALLNVGMLREALVNGPRWFTDYSLYGMQYGAQQVFGAANDYVRQDPKVQVYIPTTWTNGRRES